jgi:hypothetical protein
LEHFTNRRHVQVLRQLSLVVLVAGGGFLSGTCCSQRRAGTPHRGRARSRSPRPVWPQDYCKIRSSESRSATGGFRHAASLLGAAFSSLTSCDTLSYIARHNVAPFKLLRAC